MKLVVKFGGTSLATVKDIKNVVKTVDKIAKKNKTVVVCSAVDGTTDELIQISSLIEKGNKKDANRMLAKISQKHKQFADHLITNPKISKSLSSKLIFFTTLLSRLITRSFRLPNNFLKNFITRFHLNSFNVLR